MFGRQSLRKYIDEQMRVTREFLREQSLLAQKRAEWLHEEVMRGLEAQRREMEEHHAEQRRKTDDLIAENQAQRAALFKMMDRLGNGGTSPAG